MVEPRGTTGTPLILFPTLKGRQTRSRLSPFQGWEALRPCVLLPFQYHVPPRRLLLPFQYQMIVRGWFSRTFNFYFIIADEGHSKNGFQVLDFPTGFSLPG